MTNPNELVDIVFGGDQPSAFLTWYQIAARTLVVYLGGLLIVRIGKGRLIGRITSLDVLLGFILGSLLSRGITGHAAISDTLVAAAALVAGHSFLTIAACRWHAVGVLLKGHAVQIVENGRAIRSAMECSHLSEHDLLEALRLQGIDGISGVAKAFKERNGEISAIEKPVADAESAAT